MLFLATGGAHQPPWRCFGLGLRNGWPGYNCRSVVASSILPHSTAMRVQTRRAIVEEVIAHCVLEVRAGHAARGCAFAVCRTAVITVYKPGGCTGSCNRQVVRQGQGQKERGGAQTPVVTCMTTTRVTHAHPFQSRTIMAMRRSIKSRKVGSPPTTLDRAQ